MPIMIDAETQLLQRDKARGTATLANLTGPDLEAIVSSRVTGAQVEVMFEGDPIPYRWRTLQIHDEGRLTFDGKTEEALDLMPLADKQAELRKVVNREIVETLKGYLGKVLPSVVEIPAGEENHHYDDKGDWKAKT